MEEKKTQRANLENKKLTFTLVGLSVSLLIVLALINMRFYSGSIAGLKGVGSEEVEEEIVPITQQNQPPPPPPPPPPPAAPEVLEIVEDDIEVEDFEMFDSEATEETIVDFKVEEEVEEEEIFTFAEEMPSFPGGEEKLFKYIRDHTIYPERAKELDIQGKIWVSFVVGKNGKIRDIKIARGVDKLLDREALRVVKTFPPWKAGKQRGKPVSVSFTLPINFVLN